jgi:endo-1,4-beta-xylanase
MINNLKKTLITALLGILLSCNSNKEIPLYENVGFHVGTSYRTEVLQSDEEFADILRNDFNSVTAANIMKMRAVLISPDSLDFSTVDDFISQAAAYDQRVHGHTLIWHQATPSFVKQIEDSTEMDAFLHHYITRYVSRYKGKVAGWDVVNEAISDSLGLFRNSCYYNALGVNFIEKAFRYAHEADPEAKLFYNDYSIEGDEVKLKATIDLVKYLLERDVPIHGIGFQMHTMIHSPELYQIKESLKAFVDMGLLVHVSELDVRINSYDEGQIYDYYTEDLQSALAGRYYDLAVLYRETVPDSLKYGITLWGFTDRYTWIRSYFKELDWPCIFDDNLGKKPAYYSFRNGLVTPLQYE